MIVIDLNLFATLSGFQPENASSFEIRDHSTVKELIGALTIPEDQVKLIFVNGRRRDLSWRLEQGDRVGLFPPVGGG